MRDTRSGSQGHAAAEASWLALRIGNVTRRDAVLGALFAAGSQGVHEDGDAIVTHFPSGTDTAAIVEAVTVADAGADAVVSDVPEVDWSGWRASVGAHRLGGIVVSPPWLRGVEAGPQDLEVVIDPAMAFGTGEHATTRGVVRLMQSIQSIPETVADLGAGSAVLAICAARLGARRVVAIELDPDAIGNAEANVEANGTAGIVHVIEGDAATLLPLVAPVGLVLANIISSVLVELLPVIGASLAPGGSAILSGILASEAEAMAHELTSRGWTIVAVDEEEGWWSALVTRA